MHGLPTERVFGVRIILLEPVDNQGGREGIFTSNRPHGLITLTYFPDDIQAEFTSVFAKLFGHGKRTFLDDNYYTKIGISCLNFGVHSKNKKLFFRKPDNPATQIYPHSPVQHISFPDSRK